MSNNKKKKSMSSNAKWGIALLVEIIVLILLVVLYAGHYINNKLGKVNRLNLDKEDLAINEGANEAQKGYRTIALFGIDTRDASQLGEGNRSDSIMIASINNETKEVKIVSVYRDTFLEIEDGSGLTSKVNAAYSYGGPKMAIQTLNANLDLEITDFITVNFLGLTKAIDDLGGITVGVEENELQVLNLAITEQINVTGIYSDGVFTTGELLLNGTQATAYARIRSTDQGDITRTERQRDVLSKMVAKAKSSDLKTIDSIIDDVFPEVMTSLTDDEMKSLAKAIFDYKLGDTVGFPLAYSPVSHPSKGAILVPANLTANVSALHKFLFGTENYVPSQTVQNISNSIQNETGVGEQAVEINPTVFE